MYCDATRKVEDMQVTGEVIHTFIRLAAIDPHTARHCIELLGWEEEMRILLHAIQLIEGVEVKANPIETDCAQDVVKKIQELRE